MLVAANAGHCTLPDTDHGCSGVQIEESFLAKEYTTLINKYLNAAGVDTVFIQEDSLSAICAIANDSNADLFYSLHFNSAGTKASGTETLYCKGSTNGKIFAECVQKQLVDTLGLPDRGCKTPSIYVTRNTNMTAILIEVGFLGNNPEEEQILINRKDDACRAIARGVTDAINKIYGQASDVPEEASHPPTKASSGNKPGMVSKYFAANEVCCHCCGRQGAVPELLQFLDDLREAIGRPLYVTSVYRCPVHNEEVGGVPNSQHTQGTAADTYCDGLSVDQLADIGVRLGADGVGRYYSQGFVHFDVRAGRAGKDIEWVG